MHYPTHLRDAFLEWIDDGMPDAATLEVNYEELEESADVFLRRFLRCSDQLPRSEAEIAIDSGAQTSTYAAAARTFLAERARERGSATA